jgi:biotin carboxyl carrier protein
LHYEIEAGGRLRHVTVTRTGDSFALSVDGRLHQVDAVRIDAHALSLIVDNSVPASPQNSAAGPEDPPYAGPDKARPTRDHRVVYTTTIAPETGTGRLVVLVGAVPVAVTVNGRRRRRTGEGGTPGSGPLRIVAPMPGKVVRVLVQTGDAVHARQPVVVVEAMKMENELRTGREGTVAEIHAREGVSVEAGALLVVIK